MKKNSIIKVNILILATFASQLFAQNTFPVGTLEINNDGIYNTCIKSGNVGRMGMGFDGAKGYIEFGAHTGNGHWNNILYMRGSNPFIKFNSLLRNLD